MVEFIELGLELIFHCCQRGGRPIIRQTRSFVTMHRRRRRRKRKISRRLSGFPLPLSDEKPPLDATIDENDNYNAFELGSDHRKPSTDDNLRTRSFSKSKSTTEETVLNALGDTYADYPQLSGNQRKTTLDEDYYDNLMSPERSPHIDTQQENDNPYEKAAVARKNRIKGAAKEPLCPNSEEFKATSRSQGHGSPI
uniref:Uncharacterized protein n=1 Tax=Romanomermis culicivorax TaxID=13658 RepID=A0A915K0D0_ROMCU